MDIRSPLAGLDVRTPDTQGGHSLFEQAILRAELEGRPLLDCLDLTDQELVACHYDLRAHLRPVQCVPEKFRTWLFLAGRGSGKSHAASAAVVLEAMTDREARILVVGPTYSEIVKTQIEGPSGILTLCPPWFRPEYKKARRQLLFPNGAMATWLPATAPSKFRGFATSFIVADELVAWDESTAQETLSECYRVNRWRTASQKARGLGPRMVITTTPKATSVFRFLLTDHREQLVVSRSHTLDNAANLDPSYIRYARRVMHTSIGQEEFGGVLRFDDLDKAMFMRVNWSAHRLEKEARPERFDSIAISVDPSTGEGKRRDQTGIIAIGTKEQPDGLTHAYILQDRSVSTPTPTVWATRAAECYRAWEPYTNKIFISAETNAGGALVRQVLKQVDPGMRIRTYRAHQSKAFRAAPVSGMAEAGLVHMVGRFPELEKELSTFTGAENERNDRVDAMCSALYFWVILRNKINGALAIEENEDVK